MGNEIVKGFNIELGLNTVSVSEGFKDLKRQMAVVNSEMNANLSAFERGEKSAERFGVTLEGLNKKQEIQAKITRKAKEELENLTSVHEKEKKALNDAADKVEKAQKAYDNLAKSGNASQKELKESVNQVKLAEKELEELSKTTSVTSKDIDEARIAFNKANKELNTIEGSIKRTTNAFEEMDKEQRIADSNMGKFSKTLDGLSGRIDNFSDKAMGIGAGLTAGVTVPVLGIGKVAMDAFYEVDEGLDTITTATGETGKSLEGLQDSFKNVYGEFPAEAEAVGGVMGEVNTRLGLTGDKLEKATKSFLEFSNITGTDGVQSVQLITRAMGDAGIEADEYERVLDLIARAAQKSGIGVDKLAESITKYGAPMRALGFEMEESVALFATWEKAGVNADIAFSGMKKSISNWAKDGKNPREEFKKTLSEIEKAPDLAEATSKAIEIFGAKAGPDLADAIKNGRFSIEDMNKALEGSEGTVHKTFKSTEDGAEEFQKSMNKVKLAGLELWGSVEETLVPILGDVGNAIEDLSGWFKELDDDQKEMIVKSAMFAAALGPVSFGIGLIGKGLSPVVGGLGSLAGKLAEHGAVAEKSAKATGLMGRSLGVVRGGLSLLTGPVGITIGVITALGLGFKYAYDHVEWFHDGVNNTGKLLKEVGSHIDFKWLKDIGGGFWDATKAVGGFVGKAIELTPNAQLTKAAFSIIGDAVSKATDKVDVYGKGVSKSTEKSLKSYTDLSMKASKKLEEIKVNHQVIGKKTFDSVSKIYNDINKDVTSKMKKRQDREMSGLKDIFKATNGLTKKEEQKLLEKARSNNSAEIKSVEIINKKIKDIYRKAKNEKRELTEKEEKKIVLLQQQMDSKVVKSLSKSEKEQRIILGRLKTNKSKLSLEAAAEVIKNSARERDESIKNAKKKRDKTIDEAIYQRDVAKTISKDQADKIIKDAERQYSESKKNAKKQHKDVVHEAEKQNKEVKDNIDEQSGHVKSKWEKMSDSVEKWSGKMAITAVAGAIDIRNGYDKWLKKTGETIDSWKTTLNKKASSMGKSVAKGAVGGLNLMIDGINSISSAIMEKKLLKRIPTDKFSTGTGASHSGLVSNGKITRRSLAIVGDKGPGNGPGGFSHEIIRKKDGRAFLTPNTDTPIIVEPDDVIYNGQQTYEMMNQGMIPRFNEGSGAFQDLKNVGGKIKDSFEIGAKFVGKIAGDIFDYVKNPGKLVDLVMGNISNVFDGVGGFTGDLGGAAFDKIKKALVGKVKQWFEEFSGADGSELLSFPITTPYHPNGPTPGYPTAFNGGRHYGIDLDTKHGTLLHAPTSGYVKEQSDYGGGKVAQLVSGRIAQYFLHLSKVLKTGPVKQGDPIVRTGNSGHYTTGAHLHYQVEEPSSGMLTNRNTKDPIAFLKSKGGGRATTGKDWTTEIRKAAKQMNVHLSAGQLNGILAQINRESNGNQAVTQDARLKDGNAGANLAKGLLQYVPSTFNSYKVAGHGNIFSGYDQLLAFFNNSNWANDIQYGKSGWGPRGHRRYETGGISTTHQFAEISEKNKPEAFIPLTNRNRAVQMIDQVMNMIGYDPGGSPKLEINSNTSVLEKFLSRLVELEQQNQSLMEKLIDVVINKKTGITATDIFNSYNSVANQKKRLDVLIKGG